jgi:hypothetical protein
MKLSLKQFDQLSDIFKETAVIIFGGAVLGALLSEKPNPLLFVGFVAYLMLVITSIYVKKFGE